jgi:hypothetical protein
LWPEILPDLFVFGITPVMRIPEYDKEGCQNFSIYRRWVRHTPMIRLIPSEINQQREIRISRRTRYVKKERGANRRDISFKQLLTEKAPS